MPLENEKVRLRAMEPEDLESLYVWENQPEYWDAGNTRQPYSRYALKEYISQADRTIFETGHMRLMIVDSQSKQPLGTVDLFDLDMFHSRIALGLFVSNEFQGQGYATAALRLVEEYVFDYLKINQLYCHISTGNEPSIKMFAKENYGKSLLKHWVREGDGFQDVIVFQRFSADYKKSRSTAN